MAADAPCRQSSTGGEHRQFVSVPRRRILVLNKSLADRVDELDVAAVASSRGGAAAAPLERHL